MVIREEIIKERSSSKINVAVTWYPSSEEIVKSVIGDVHPYIPQPFSNALFRHQTLLVSAHLGVHCTHRAFLRKELLLNVHHPFRSLREKERESVRVREARDRG